MGHKLGIIFRVSVRLVRAHVEFKLIFLRLLCFLLVPASHALNMKPVNPQSKWGGSMIISSMLLSLRVMFHVCKYCGFHDYRC